MLHPGLQPGWEGTWEEALEQADPVMLFECMGYIETLGILGTWEDLAHWGSMDSDLKSGEPLRSCDPEMCKVMLACAFFVEMNRLSSMLIQDVRYTVCAGLSRATTRFSVRDGFECGALNVIYSMSRHVLSSQDESGAIWTLRYKPSDEHGGWLPVAWAMRVDIPGYSPEGWRLYDLPRETTVVVVSTDGTVVLVAGPHVGDQYEITRVGLDRSQTWAVANEYARRYGYPLYTPVANLYKRLEIKEQNIRRPGKEK
jgi:hypothetical protein